MSPRMKKAISSQNYNRIMDNYDIFLQTEVQNLPLYLTGRRGDRSSFLHEYVHAAAAAPDYFALSHKLRQPLLGLVSAQPELHAHVPACDERMVREVGVDLRPQLLRRVADHFGAH